VYVAQFPSGAGKRKISTSTGTGAATQQPRWNPNGKELFYLTGTAGKFTLTSVSFNSRSVPGREPELEIGVSKPLFEVRANGFHPASGTFFYSVSRDGRRFLIDYVDSTSEPVLNFVVNWEAGFARSN
jgi:hypothetical protein